MKKICSVIVGIACIGTFTFGDAINIDSTSFKYTQDFSSLGTEDAVWVDGETIQGVYLRCTATNLYPTTIPTTALRSQGAHGSAGAYNMGLDGSSDRALGWYTKSGTGTGYTGIQFRNQVSGTTNLTIAYTFVLEQWSLRNTSAQEFTLQYKVTNYGAGPTNNISSSGWTTLGSAVTPVVGDGTEPDVRLDGNLNQFIISGTETINVRTGQLLTFRLVDNDQSGDDAMVGIDSITIEIVPEASSLSLFLISSAGFFIARHRLRK
ncbi:MAG: hypothetical protein WC959_00455 [Kiritimatiellales bacterium]